MAFINESAAGAATANTTAANDKFEKAVAFINVDVVLGDGSKRRVGGVPLKASEALHKALLELTDEQFGKLTLEYSLSRVSTEAKTYEFKLG